VLGYIDTRQPQAVEREVATIYGALFPEGDDGFVARAFEWVTHCFDGSHPDYQAIDLKYHDFEHTLQGTLCMVRLLRGWHQGRATPQLTQPMFELGLLAILFHDAGYLKRRDDLEGTGAKYTATHVSRSAEFARAFLTAKNYREGDTAAVQHMIRCTGVAVNLLAIPFANESERLLGYALATADLLGQMAAPDYVDKLPALFREFAEAAQHGGRKAARFAVYGSAEDLRRMTPAFWDNYVLPRLNVDFLGLYRFLNDPYPNGPNLYLQLAEQNVTRILRELAG
jgi:hypothetical protein